MPPIADSLFAAMLVYAVAQTQSARLVMTSSPSPLVTYKELGACALPLIAFVAALALARPFGDVFYGGDDWGYAWSARQLLEYGRLQASDWATAAAVPQIVIGAAVAELFGLNPASLNLSMMATACVGVVLIYVLCRRADLSRGLAALITSLVTLTPLYLGFAGTFMSDMTYTVIMIAACIAYISALQNFSLPLAILGGVLATLAFSTRQIGIVLPAAFAATLVTQIALRSEPTARRAATVGFVGVLLPVATVTLYHFFPPLFGGRTLAQSINLSRIAIDQALDLRRDARNLYLLTTYLTALLLPLILLLVWHHRSEVAQVCRRHAWLSATAVIVSVGFYFWRSVGGAPPIVRGDLWHTSVYSVTAVPFGDHTWLAMVLVGAAIASILLIWGIAQFLDGYRAATPPSVATIFLGFCLAGHAAMTISFVAFFNNYFLPMVPLAAILIGQLWRKTHAISVAAAMIVTIPFGAWSVVLIDSHLRFVEASARTADEMVAAGVPADTIAAYPSWIGWRDHDRLADDLHTRTNQAAFGIFRRALDRSTFALRHSSETLPGTKWQVERRFNYNTFLGTQSLVLWRQTRRSSADRSQRGSNSL